MYSYLASVVRWVDGDTVDLRVDLGFRNFMETRFRLYGIDTPERGQENHDKATEFCKSHAPEGSTVFIRVYKASDKYGRWLVDIYTDDHNLNNRLVEFGLAVPYFGGTKAAAV
jgi:micrococcal nuclease